VVSVVGNGAARQGTLIVQTKRIGWDGVSFLIPANWELALYRFLKHGVARIEIEDEYSVRIEIEWFRPQQSVAMSSVLARYEKAARPLTERADRQQKIEGLPPGWMATHYTLKNKFDDPQKKTQVVKTEGLVTAFFLSPSADFFCFLLLHFHWLDKETPADIMKLIASELAVSKGPLRRWELFDIAFDLPEDFLLENTLFDIGSKLLIFRWQMRRFYIWHFSCADRFLSSDVAMEDWVTGYLNGSRLLRGPRFFPGRNGAIRWKRRRRYPLGHRDEIARWCFRYEARCHLDRARNQLVAWVFSYRKPDDLNRIPPDLRFGKASGVNEIC
jgi:hypothetical protein